MNLPNKLTMMRVFLIPFFVFFLLRADALGEYAKWIAFAIFIVACCTDFLDGKIAREYNLVTNFGKFMDPLADKLLVVSALVCFVTLDRIPTWIVLIIIAREFIISGFRLVAAEQGNVIAASWWGKLKTAETMLMIIFMIPNFEGDVIRIIELVLIYISLALTVLSLIDYMIKNRHVLVGSR